MTTENLISIYDFEIFPYALGDVLTWNIRSAIRCEETGSPFADIYICLDEKHHASIYQRGLVNPDNFELFFSELYSAFGTHPKLGNFYIFRNRESMIAQLKKIAPKNKHNSEALRDYLTILKYKASDRIFNKIWHYLKNKLGKQRILKKAYRYLVPNTLTKMTHNLLSHEDVLNQYFIKYIYSHDKINQFYLNKNYIPFLKESLGCNPDVNEIIARQFNGKKIVCIHLRLRKLDLGYGGEHTYTRDSDFLEWYDFLRQTSEKYPDIQFVALGRLQEKPLEMLRLPNVISLRVHGMGLGHELTLMLKSDLFIGTSSGFAALANFSSIPYFITRMNPESCNAYAIAQGENKLPFAKENQQLIYEEENAKLLMNLLETGLNLAPHSMQPKNNLVTEPQQIDITDWLTTHSKATYSARTTCRFYIDDNYRNNETTYLLLSSFEKCRQAFINNDYQKARSILLKIKNNFPNLCQQCAEYLQLEANLAAVETYP